MKVLYVHGSSKIEGIINALRKLGIDHEIYPTRMVDVFVNDSEAIEVAAHCRQSGITHIMSIHLIDTLAVAAQKARISYP